MAEPARNGTLLNPDLAFVREIKRIGGDALKYCYQCGTCTAVCPITPDVNPFPRKEMLWAQWGLKERLTADPDAWLCHGCGDCTAYCPRGAKPSEVMAALRSYSITHHAVPTFFGKALSSPAYIPLLIAIPVLVMLLGFALTGGFSIPPGPVAYAKIVPFLAIEIIGNGFFLLAMIGAGIGLAKFWRGMREQQEALGTLSPAGESRAPTESLLRIAVAVVRETLAHRRFRECGEARARSWQHAGMFYGFLLLFTASLGRMFYHYAFGNSAELSLTDPVKVIGNLGGLAMLGGLAGVMLARFGRMAGVSTSSYFDWFLIWALFMATISGFASQAVRLGGGVSSAYYTYLVHLVFVFVLLIYLPYSKFAHLLYRFAALLFARRTGREVNSI